MERGGANVQNTPCACTKCEATLRALEHFCATEKCPEGAFLTCCVESWYYRKTVESALLGLQSDLFENAVQCLNLQDYPLVFLQARVVFLLITLLKKDLFKLRQSVKEQEQE